MGTIGVFLGAGSLVLGTSSHKARYIQFPKTRTGESRVSSSPAILALSLNLRRITLGGSLYTKRTLWRRHPEVLMSYVRFEQETGARIGQTPLKRSIP